MPTKRGLKAPCRPGDAPSLHERLIRALVNADPRMYRNGFWQAVRGVAKAEGIDPGDISGREFRPDAYLIDHERQHINIVEVEVTCPLSDRKKDDYGWFWFQWDAEETDWEPRLFVVDRYGHGNELDLSAMYWGKVDWEAKSVRGEPRPLSIWRR